MRVAIICGALCLVACWEPVTFAEPREVPEAALGEEMRTLRAQLGTKADPTQPTSSTSTGKSASPPPTGAAPHASDARMRFVEVTPEAAERGKAAFAMCVGCHGPEARGRVGIAPSLASESFLAAASDRFLIDTIKNGRPGTTMTPWGAALKDPRIHDIIAWLRTRTKVPAARLDDSPAKGDLAAGKKLFREVCATCHGRSGAGYQESGSGTGIGRKAFLASVTDGFLRHLIKHGKTRTPMRAFARGAPTAVANLESGEIENLITYMRASAW